MAIAPFATLTDVVAALSELELAYRRANDRRAIFVTLYGIVSTEMRRRVDQGAFVDPAWVHRYAVAFADLFRVALTAYDAGQYERVPKAWRLCFDAARAGTGLVLQDMLLGVNAHVNNDLPLALHAIAIDPGREAKQRDHAAVNEVLASVTDRASQVIAELYAPGLAAMDDCAGQLDEMTSLFSLQVARDSAWEAAVSLANARSPLERTLVTRLIGTRAAGVARLLLAPSSNPALVQTCRMLEQGTGWQRLLTAATGGLLA